MNMDITQIIEALSTLIIALVGAYLGYIGKKHGNAEEIRPLGADCGGQCGASV